MSGGKADKDGVIYLPGEQSAAQPEPAPSFDELTPREIVVELDKYIVGQTAAKRAVAIALRNRVRRQKLQPEMAERAEQEIGRAHVCTPVTVAERMRPSA